MLLRCISTRHCQLSPRIASLEHLCWLRPYTTPPSSLAASTSLFSATSSSTSTQRRKKSKKKRIQHGKQAQAIPAARESPSPENLDKQVAGCAPKLRELHNFVSPASQTEHLLGARGGLAQSLKDALISHGNTRKPPAGAKSKIGKKSQKRKGGEANAAACQVFSRKVVPNALPQGAARYVLSDRSSLISREDAEVTPNVAKDRAQIYHALRQTLKSHKVALDEDLLKIANLLAPPSSRNAQHLLDQFPVKNVKQSEPPLSPSEPQPAREVKSLRPKPSRLKPSAVISRARPSEVSEEETNLRKYHVTQAKPSEDEDLVPNQARARVQKPDALKNKMKNRKAVQNHDLVNVTESSTLSSSHEVNPSIKESSANNPSKKVAHRPRRSLFEDNPNIELAAPEQEKLTALDIPRANVPALQYGLDRVLFNPGVYQLQDLHTRVYNFDPCLQKIMPLTEFNLDALGRFVPPSEDSTLTEIAKAHRKRYVGSTSSMTGILSHFHYLLSAFRPVNIDMLSKAFPETLDTFTGLQRTAVSVFLRWRPDSDTYAIEISKEHDKPNILAILGRCLEKLLSTPKEEFEAYRRSSSKSNDRIPDLGPESYNYSTLGDFLMRSQLDAHDSRLPGAGMFDIKTRATVAVRMMVSDYEDGTGYEIREHQGQYESYEREYYDMLRSVALKYSLQARMGRMDGIFVAYHNVMRIFGFQYIDLAELDRALHGQSDTVLGDKEFKLSLILLNKVFNKATKRFPGQTLRFVFETRETQVPFMYIFAKPISDDEADEIQETSNVACDEGERKLMSLSPTPSDNSGIEAGWSGIKAMVEEEIAADVLGEDADDIGSDLYNRLSDFASQISKKRQELTHSSSQTSDLSPDDDEVEELTREAREVEAELSKLRSIAGQFIAKTKIFKEKLQQREECSPGLMVIINQLNEIIEDVQKESGRFDRLLQDDVDEGELEEAVSAGLEVAGEIHQIPNNEDYEELNTSRDFPTVLGSKSSENDEGSESFYDEGLGTKASTESTNPSEDVEPLSGAGNVEEFHGKDESNLLSLETEDEPLLAMTLTIRNKVNNTYITRPKNLHPSHHWAVEYLLEEIEEHTKSRGLYEACLKRRDKAYRDIERRPKGANSYFDSYQKMLQNISDNSRKWREQRDMHEKDMPKVVFQPHHETSLSSKEQ